MMQQQRSDVIQAVRAVAACLVMVNHLLLKSGFGHGWLEALGSIGVDFFFVVSGFVMHGVAQRSGRGVRAAQDFAIARFLRIYPLYWAVTFSMAGIWLAVGATEFARKSVLPIGSLLLATRATSALYSGWTLTFEVYFYAVISILLLSRHFTRLFVGWAAISILAAAICAGQHYPVIPFSAMSLEFIAGFALAAIVQIVPAERYWAGAAIAGAIGCCGTLALMMFEYDHLGLVWESHRAIPGALTAAMVIFALLGLERGGRVRVPRNLVGLGDISYGIYLWHPVTQLWFSAFFADWEAGAGRAATVMATCAMTVAVASLSHRFFEKPIMRKVAPTTMAWAPASQSR